MKIKKAEQGVQEGLREARRLKMSEVDQKGYQTYKVNTRGPAAP